MIGNVSDGSAVAEDGSAVAEDGFAFAEAGSAVAEDKGTAVGSVKQQTQWMLELSSSIIASLVAAAPPRKKVEQVKQLLTLEQNLAKLIGFKIRAYYKQHWPECGAVGATLKSKMPPYRNTSGGEATEDPFWVKITNIVYDDVSNTAPENACPKSRAAVAVELVPVASRMDDRGKMIGAHETVCKGPKPADDEVTIPFKEWLSTKSVNEAATDTAKRTLLQCISFVTQQMRRRVPQVRMLKKKNRLSVVAETDLNPGDLIIPLFCRRHNSIVFWSANNQCF